MGDLKRDGAPPTVGGDEAPAPDDATQVAASARPADAAPGGPPPGLGGGPPPGLGGGPPPGLGGGPLDVRGDPVAPPVPPVLDRGARSDGTGSDAPGPPHAFAAPGAALLTPPTHRDAVLAPPGRTRVASLTRLYTFATIAAVALVAALAARALPDWEDGRWWLASVGLGAVAVLASAATVIVAVSALGQIVRRPTVLRGTAASAIGLALGCGLFVGAGIVALDDWFDLDVPNAWDRLEIGDSEGRTLGDVVSGARDATAAGEGSIRTEGRLGGCYGGTVEVTLSEVPCAEAHTVQLVAQVEIDPSVSDDPGDRRAAGRDLCDTAVSTALGDTVTDAQTVALVPDEVSWLAGDRGAVCVLEFDDPVQGSAVG